MSETLVRMPRLADTLVEGTLGRWLKQVGESVGRGEPLASIETDKVTTDLTSPAAGTLLEVLVPEGQTVAVETPIARIGDAATAPAQQPTSRAQRPASPAQQPSSPAQQPVPSTSAAASRKPTPVAARLLAEHGLTIDQVPNQSRRVTRADVLKVLNAAAPPVSRTQFTAPPGELMPLTSMRRAIADHMTRAHQTIPHGQTVIDVDVTALVAWREAHKNQFQRAEGVNLTYTVYFVAALARALAAHSGVSVDIGVAVALDAGLIVPVLRRADALSLADTARGIGDLASRARTNQLKPDETQGARMTVTNVGSFGNLSAMPIVPLGQLGILGPGLVEPRPLPGPDGGIRRGWRCLMALVFDRRAFDDFAADRFLRRVTDELLALAQ